MDTKLYIKEGVVCQGNQIVIKRQKTIKNRKGDVKNTQVTVYNPSEKLILEDGWEIYTPNYGLSSEELLLQAKNDKIYEVKLFDASFDVNDCIINHNGQELHYWASKTDRDALKSAVQDCINIGRTKYRLDLRELNTSLNIQCEVLLHMLTQLEIYAIDCYNKTTDHIYNINNLNTLEEIDNYDYSVGYPEKLIFEICEED